MSKWDELAKRAGKMEAARKAAWDRLEAERKAGASAERLTQLHSQAEGIKDSIRQTQQRMGEMEGRELRMEMKRGG